MSLFVFSFQAFAVPTSLTYQGRILKSDGSALEYNNVAFIFKIMDPTGQCLLYQEQSNPIDMTSSGGVFDVPIGLGSVSYPSNGTTTNTDVFDNTNALPCSGGGTYNPVNTDLRLLRVSFYDGGGWRQISPDNTVRSVPFAAYSKSSESAKKLGTNVASDFLLKAGLPTCGAGTFLTWSGSALTCGGISGASGGTVTDVIAGTGLNVGAGPGGTINASGTLNVDVGTTTGKIIQVAANNKLPAIDGSNLINITASNISGTVSIANGGSGQSTKTAAFDALSPTTTKGDIIVNNGSNNVRVGAGSNGQYLQADSSQSSGVKWASVTDTLSGLSCGSNDVPYWNGSAWACKSSSSSNTVSTMMLRDTSGNFAANQGTLNSLVLDNGSGSNITVTTPVAFTSWQLKLPSTAGTANQVLKTDGSGNTSWATVSSQWNDGASSSINYTAGNVGIGTTVPAASLDVAGGVRVGDTAAPCSASNKGTIRYNTTTNVLEFCNGTGWNLVQAAACTDPTPSVFSFANQANIALSTLVISEIIQITGINCSVPVTISGPGSPEYQICSDSGCSSVVQGWTISPSSITTGQYLQVRQTSNATGGVTNQATIIIGSGASVWSVSALGDCASSPAIGTVCADGTVYAGLTPDGNVPMYASRCDAGQTWNGVSCTGARVTLSWNNGSGSYTTSGATSAVAGESNSNKLDALVDGGAPYEAARYCRTLNLNGYTDWYLPAKSELNVLYGNKAVIRNFDESGSLYWSSTEQSNNQSWYQRFSDGTQQSTGGSPSKHVSYLVRCVRK